MHRTFLAVVFALFLSLPCIARADIMLGETPPDFTKKLLVGSAEGPDVSLYASYAGKIVILYLFGHNCPVCLVQAPNFEAQINQHYQQTAPDLVKVIGADSWNGTPAQVANFRNVSGATYPLLLYAGTATGGNLDLLYGPWDNFLVLDLRENEVRYHAALVHVHGERFKPQEIRNVVDPLLLVDAGAPLAALSLRAKPNPATGPIDVSVRVPAEAVSAILTVHDLTGRRVATLHEGPLESTERTLRWRPDAALAAGVYWIRLSAAGRDLQQRIVLLP
jgi:hypothetical protein